LAPLPPKLATYLVGVNDIGLDKLNRFDDFFVTKMRLEQKSFWQAFLDGEDRLVMLSRYSHMANLALMMIRSAAASQARLRHTQIDFQAVGPLTMSDAERTAQLDAQVRDFLPLYEIRLTQLIQLSRHMKIDPVLITQPALWGRGIDPTTGVDLGPISDFFWDRLELYNAVTRHIAAAMDVPIIDLAVKMPKDSKYFYDWIHFTREGSARVAEIVSTELIPIVAQRYPQFRK
jgi:lysophospholipase L1-like esterase